MKFQLSACVVLALLPTAAWAVSPQSIAGGAELFTQQWQSHGPGLRGDGLGPLFNADSCATCHQQGGIGGAGEAAFNANSIGIDSIEVYGRGLTDTVLTHLVSRFHPGFIQDDGSLLNVMPLSHHGGTGMLQELHKNMKGATAAEFDKSGGPSGAAEVRIANGSPIAFEQNIDGFRIRISARIYSRNTTALFGSGLIDRIPDPLLERQAQLQKQHAEISGRPSTLEDGRFGKFGWRANLASLLEFNDRACANEMGLQTRRMVQASDATNRGYRNTGPDINDEQLQMLTQFIAALPSPRQEVPSDSLAVASLGRGEALFNQVGCGVCHVRDMAPASGIYSDLLLHDMGRESIDLTHAEPYIVDRELVTKEVEVELPSNVGVTVSYSGRATNVPLSCESSPGAGITRPAFSFSAPQSPTTLASFRLIDSTLNPDTRNNSVAISKSILNRRGTEALVKIELREKMHLQPTNFNQEWRTAPLWGVRDSAPYWHDGRAETILEAIAMHDGEAAGTRDRFLQLSYEDRQNVLAFLDSLVAP